MLNKYKREILLFLLALGLNFHCRLIFVEILLDLSVLLKISGFVESLRENNQLSL